jgi:hypothetical protein
MATAKADALVTLLEVDLGQFVLFHQFDEASNFAYIEHVVWGGSSVFHLASPTVLLGRYAMIRPLPSMPCCVA